MKYFFSLADKMTTLFVGRDEFENDLITKETLAAMDLSPPRPLSHSDPSISGRRSSFKVSLAAFKHLEDSMMHADFDANAADPPLPERLFGIRLRFVQLDPLLVFGRPPAVLALTVGRRRCFRQAAKRKKLHNDRG